MDAARRDYFAMMARLPNDASGDDRSRSNMDFSQPSVYGTNQQGPSGHSYPSIPNMQGQMRMGGQFGGPNHTYGGGSVGGFFFSGMGMFFFVFFLLVFISNNFNNFSIRLKTSMS